VLNRNDGSVRVDDGIALRFREHRPSRAAGDSRDFLLVHGLSSNALLWEGVGAALAAAGHRSVAVDLRSHGGSDGSDELGFERIVTDLAAVCATMGLERPVAVGQSWGGNVVLELGAARPDVVSGVVAVDGGLIALADRFPDVESCWAALAPPRFDHLRWAELEAAVVARTAGWPDGAARAQLGNLAPGTDGSVRAILTRERHRSIIEHLYAHRPLERLPRLEAPMLLLAVTGGARSVLDEGRIAAARAVAGAPFTAVRLPGRDHDVHLQEPATVTTLTLDWLAGRALPEVA
jgi:pimeloyl-ACP methyl ester carboxylesterase